jgi:DNA-binding beta-propeller fold protein YncE
MQLFRFRPARHRSNVLRLTATATVGCAIALTGAAQASTTAAGLTSTALTSYRSAVGRPAVIPPGTRAEGMAAAATPIQVEVVLNPRDPAALKGFATAVSTPGTAQYRHFLARGQFAAEFGPTATAIAAVTGYLRSQGLQPGTLTPDHLMIPVQTTVGGVDRAFQVTMTRYEQPSGASALANNQSPTLPAAIAADVQGIVGLDTFSAPPARPLTAPHPLRRTAPAVEPRTTGPAPCSAATSEANATSGWTYNQLASAYGFTKLYTAGDLGSGATVALFEEQTYAKTDISAFQACYKTKATVTNVSVDGGSKDAPGEEAVLDIETVIGLAPKAKLLVYETAPGNAGEVAGYDAIVSQDKAQVITSSWSSQPFTCDVFVPSSTVSAENTIFEEAASNGQATFVASGDVGSAGCMPNGGTRELSTGVGPDAVTTNSATQTVYEANYTSGSITVVSEQTLGVVDTLSLGSSTEPDGIAVDPTSDQLYVAERGTGDVVEINGATCNGSTQSNCKGTVIALGSGTEPDGIAVDSTTRTAYVAAAGAAGIGVINEKTDKLVATASGGKAPTGMAVDASTNTIYFTDFDSGGVGTIAGGTCDAADPSGCPTTADEAPAGDGPYSLAVDHALNRIYVDDFDSSELTVLNETTGTTVATVSSLDDYVLGPTGVAVSPSGTSVLVAAVGSGGEGAGVAVVSTSTNKVTRVISGGTAPFAVATDQPDDYAWVADDGTSSVRGGLVWLPLLLSVEDPSGQQFVTAVGGTDLTKLGPAPTESAWNEALAGAGAGTGGISADWPMPSYQTGPGVVSKDSSGTPCAAPTGKDCREVPDVSASADPEHGYVIVYQGSWTSVGGTSAATPLWASLIALIDVQSGTLHSVGFINPAIYKLVAAGKAVVNDVKTGNDDYTTTGGGLYPATKHYDMATGLGSPIGGTLATDLG